MSFLDDINAVSERISELQNAAVKYADYQEVKPSDMEGFHAPESEFQKRIAKKAAGSSMFVVGVVGIVFALCGVLAIVQGTVIPGIVITAIGAAIIGFWIFLSVGKTEVLEGGRAAWKQTRMTSGSRRGRRRPIYLVSVYFEHPEKSVVKLVQTTKADYKNIYEDTPILLIKKGFMVNARIDEEAEDLPAGM